MSYTLGVTAHDADFYPPIFSGGKQGQKHQIFQVNSSQVRKTRGDVKNRGHNFTVLSERNAYHSETMHYFPSIPLLIYSEEL